MTSQQFQNSSYISFIHRLLPTLAATDYFTIVAGKSSFNSVLVRASKQNLENVTEIFLPLLNFATDEQENNWRTAFGILSESRGMPQVNTSAGCQSAIVYITDRELDSEIPELVQQLNQQYMEAHGDESSVKIFVNSNVTDFEKNGTAEQNITCNNGGIWNDISDDDTNTASQEVSSYYRALSRSVFIDEPVWSNIHRNKEGFIRNGTTLCQPVYDDARSSIHNGTIGVTCISLPVSEVERFSSSQEVQVRGSEVGQGTQGTV